MVGGFNTAWFFGVTVAAILALVTTAPPEEPKLALVIVAALSFAIGVTGVAVGFWRNYEARLPWTERRKTAMDVATESTSLRLQFFGGQVIPTEIRRENVNGWYALYHPRMELQHEGRVVLSTPMNWTIFVAFEKPARPRQLLVSFSNPGFPPCEVKTDTQRFAVVHVSGEIPPGILEIYGKTLDRLVPATSAMENRDAQAP
ncbi:MAG: hypothetical protein ACREQX_19205 [Candidatus Binataceae bacterium]